MSQEKFSLRPPGQHMFWSIEIHSQSESIGAKIEGMAGMTFSSTVSAASKIWRFLPTAVE